MRGMQSSVLIGAIMGGRGKKNKGYQQPGGILLYLGIPFVGMFLALNTLAGNTDVEYPVIPVWITSLIILLVTVGVVWFVAWVRKVDREEHKRQAELKKKQWLESLGSKRSRA